MIHFACRSNTQVVCGASTATGLFTLLERCITCWRCRIQLIFIDSF